MQPTPEGQLADRTRWLIEQGEKLGFALVGIGPAVASDRSDFVRNWLNQQRHGEMHYMAKNLDQRLDPRQLLPGAKSVICVADLYDGTQMSQSQGLGRFRGRVARYAWGRDYHKVMKKRLHQLTDRLHERFRGEACKSTVDTAPILEREHATRAGLGWIGKHTLLIHPKLGSWLLLGTIVTTLELADSESLDFPAPTVVPSDHCGTCTRCIDACPTQCITPYALDASQCISYLTLEHRQAIDPALHHAMGDWIAGCDVCQEVCPHNQVKPENQGAEMKDFDLLEILGWTQADRRRAFQGSALKRIKLDMFKRNALIALGNHLRQHPDETLSQRIRQLAQDATESELVQTTAKQVLAKL